VTKELIIVIIIFAISGLSACASKAGILSDDKPNSSNSLTVSQTATVSSAENNPAKVIPTAALSPVPYTPIIRDPVITDMKPLHEISGKGVTNHDYIPDSGVFKIEINNDKNAFNPMNCRPFLANFKSRSGTTYNFEIVESQIPLSIKFPSEHNYDINLMPGMTYQIVAQATGPFGFCYGLIISQNYEIIFAGITDSQVYGDITVDDGFFPLTHPSLDVKISRILKDSLKDIDSKLAFTRITNLEIQFTLLDKTFYMHQGQSAMLGDYKIDLTSACDYDTRLKFNPGSIDGGPHGFSFVITKLVNNNPLPFMSPGDEIAHFADPDVENKIRDILGVSNKDITRMDLVGLQILQNPNPGFSDLRGLDKCLALSRLNFDNNQIEDFSALSNLSGLSWLTLNNNKIGDIHWLNLANLRSLKSLSLNENQITDISALSSLTQIDSLDLSYNQISDISALSSLTEIRELNLKMNYITDISALSTMVELTTLILDGNQISDVSALALLTKLNTLQIDGNPYLAPSVRSNITDISALSSLTELRKLVLEGNQNISNIASLASLTKLKELDLANNKVSDISALVNLPLRNLNLSYNQISDIKPLVENTKITKGTLIFLQGNPLNDKSINEYIPELNKRGIEVHF
jgi:Leucine-rich repeat (LRR) protein